MTIFEGSIRKGGEYWFQKQNVDTVDSAGKIILHNTYIPLELKDGLFKSKQTQKDLKPLQSDSQNFLLLDITCEAYNIFKIADYFTKYKHILYQTNTGLRGVLFCNLKSSEVVPTYSKIWHDIKHLGTLNKEVTQIWKIFFPLEKCIEISKNEDGELFKAVKFFCQHELPDIPLKSENFNDCCLEYYKELGFVKNYNDNKYYKDGLSYVMPSYSPWKMYCEEPAYNIDIQDKVKKYKTKEIYKRLEYQSDTEVLADTLTENEYKDTCDKFLKEGGCLAIKSYMGSNKSSVLGYILKNTKKKVLFITSRISLAQEFKKKFGIPLYSDKIVKDTKYKGSLICQYDSLLKLNPKNYDLVVVDEFVSVLFHSTDNLSNSKKELINKFLGFLKKDLVVSDAFLNAEVLKILGRDVKTFTNLQKDTIPLQELNEKDFFIEVNKALREHGQISISTNSVKTIEKKVEYYCSLNDKTYTTVTGPKSEVYKESTLKKLNRKQYSENIIIYSPTLSLGVSIFSAIKVHFHYDTGNSTNTIQSIQMLRRARKVDKIYYFVQEKYRNLATNYESLKNYLLNHITSENSWIFDLGSDFKNQVFSTGKYYIQIEVFKNILKLNNRESFNEFLRYNFENVNSLQNFP